MSKTVGNYELGGKLGAGSYAFVYQATHRFSMQQFAMKVISKGASIASITC